MIVMFKMWKFHSASLVKQSGFFLFPFFSVCGTEYQSPYGDSDWL